MNKLSTYPQPSHVKQTAVLIVIFATMAALTGFAIGRHPIKEANRQLASAKIDLAESNAAIEKLGSERDGLKQRIIDLEGELSLKADEQATLSLAIRSAELEAKTLRADNASLTAELSRALAPKPKPKPRIRPASYTGSIPTLIRSVARSRGLSAADTTALLELARRESTFRPTAVNGSCKGLFQLKTTNPNWRDPEWNTNAAITYCQRRYGSVSAALRAHDRKGWY